MKTKAEQNALREEAETLNIKCAELSEEELAQVEGGSWFGQRKGTESRIAAPKPLPPRCFSGNVRSVSSCPSPAVCSYRDCCVNNPKTNKPKKGIKE